jgi:hypothetical protein
MSEQNPSQKPDSGELSIDALEKISGGAEEILVKPTTSSSSSTTTKPTTTTTTVTSYDKLAEQKSKQG